MSASDTDSGTYGAVINERIAITNKTENLYVVREFITSMVQQSRLRKEDGRGVILAVDEAVSNIIQHAYEEDVPEASIEVEVTTDAKQFEVFIRDSGKSFTPATGEKEQGIDMDAHVKEGNRRGLGIFIMRQIMDEVKYSFKEGVKNELRLVKYIR